MIKKYFVLSFMLLQGLSVVASENPLKRSMDKVPQFEKRSQSQELAKQRKPLGGSVPTYYYDGCCGNRKSGDMQRSLKPLAPAHYEHDCP